MIIGIVGLVLLSIGWISETRKLIKEKRSKLDLKFTILYTLGSLCLVVYSFQINNLVFIILNGIVVLLSLFPLYYTIKK